MTTVLDYSNWRPPSPQALKDAGVVGVMRYIAPKAWGWPKAITVGELTDLHSAGLQVGFNFEKNPGDWQGGYNAGTQNGQAAAQAMKELGIPTGIPVFFSYDEEVAPASFPAAATYHRGCRDGLGGRPADAYGEGALIEYLAAQGLLTRGWESESTSFPGNASPTPHTVLVQHYGQQVPGLPGAYDVNTVMKPDWGQYPSPVTPPPTPPAEEPEMQMASATNQDGRPEVFWVGGDGHLYNQWRNLTGGGWSVVNNLSDGKTAFAAVTAFENKDPDGTVRIEIFVIMQNGARFHRWQTVANGSWSDWATV